MFRTARILAILLAVVLVGGGIYAAYNTGFNDGAISTVVTGDNGGTQTVVVPTGYLGRPFGWHGGFLFFPFFPILFFILLIGVFRPRRWGGGPGRGWSHHGGPGYGGWGPPQDMIEQRLKEWHKQAHGDPTADSSGAGRNTQDFGESGA